MKWMRWSLLLLCISLFPVAATARSLVADISDREISIDSGFRGTDLLLFGARLDAGDIVVAIRGPVSDYLVRKKERIGGIWVNTKQVRFHDVNGYYSLAASKPLHVLHTPYLLDSLELGISNLQEQLEDKASIKKSPILTPFSQALLEYQKKKHLYPEALQDVSFIGETLFRTHLDFPEKIRRGTYTAEIYLIADGQLIGMQSTPIRVEKRGFDAFIYDLAYDHAVVYGILAILLALGGGWVANMFFKRL